MGEIVNLRDVKKRRAREADAAKATENRIRHGRTLAEKTRDVRVAARRQDLSEGARLDLFSIIETEPRR